MRSIPSLKDISWGRGIRRFSSLFNDARASKNAKIAHFEHAIATQFPDLEDIELEYVGKVESRGGRPGVFQSNDDTGRHDSQHYALSFSFKSGHLDRPENMDTFQAVDTFSIQNIKRFLERNARVVTRAREHTLSSPQGNITTFLGALSSNHGLNDRESYEARDAERSKSGQQVSGFENALALNRGLQERALTLDAA